MAETDSLVSIKSLPAEIIIIILQNDSINYLDILNFGDTCTQFNTIIKNDQSLWKNKLNTRLQPEVFEVVDKQCDGDWLKETKLYFKLKKNIYSEIIKMSPKFFKRDTEIAMEDILIFFKLALARKINYFLTISILCDIVKTGNKLMERNVPCIKPYTLTEVYYTKMVLRYLIHEFLMVKWSQMCRLKQLAPEKIVNFFFQWIDTDNLHLYEYVEKKIKKLVSEVECHLENNHPLKATSHSDRYSWANGLLHDNMWSTTDSTKILSAITYVIYKQKRMVVLPAANLDTLDIIKVLNTNCGNVTVVAAIYEAVARRCGVRCDLITFPNHMFLEWRENYEHGGRSPTFTINLTNGELERKRQCPFSQSNDTYTVKYRPDAVLQHLIKTFNESIGAIRNWHAQNVFHLLNFRGTEYDDQTLYRNFFGFLTEQMSTPCSALDIPVDLKCMEHVFRDFIWSLANLNKCQNLTITRIFTINHHESRVKFAVGMICYHVRYDYVCIIRGWDTECTASPEWQARMAIHRLDFGAEQPFYNVVAVDYSERYVAQENLREVTQPTRLYYLEDMIAREFAYFDGFAYVPNEEKAAQYPGDGPIREMYRTRAEQKT